MTSGCCQLWQVFSLSVSGGTAADFRSLAKPAKPREASEAREAWRSQRGLAKQGDAKEARRRQHDASRSLAKPAKLAKPGEGFQRRILAKDPSEEFSAKDSSEGFWRRTERRAPSEGSQRRIPTKDFNERPSEGFPAKHSSEGFPRTILAKDSSEGF